MPSITASELRALLSYDPVLGTMCWLNDRAPKFRAGDRAGTQCPRGYRMIKVNLRTYKEHRLVWLYMTGEWPPHEIDHINGDKSDNRWCNLRAATRSQNRCNVRRYRNNTSGSKGVYWLKKNKKWAAQISIDQKQTHLGLFASREAAVAAYEEAALKHHGAFARLA